MNTCGFCKVPCNNEWCVTNNETIHKCTECCEENKILKIQIQELIDIILELTE